MGSLFSAEHMSSAYGEYGIVTTYLWSEGIIEIPISSSGVETAEMVVINQPLGSKIVMWVAERMTVAPTLPSPVEKTGEVLNYSKIMPNAPKPSGDGQNYIYSASGIYVFFLSSPISYSSGNLYQAQEPLDTEGPQVLSPSLFTIPAGSIGGTVFSTDHSAAAYTEYAYETEYVWMNGCVQQPTTTVGASCEIIQCCSPYGWRKVTWSAERACAPPVLPTPAPLTGEYLNYYIIRPVAPKVTADGQNYIYRCTGEYWFWMTEPPDETVDLLGIGVVGYDGEGEQVMLPSEFNDNLIRP